MFKRLWPAPLLTCALLLATTSTSAKETLDSTTLPSGGATSVFWWQGVPRAPVGTPATPGDDDMPNRREGLPGNKAPGSSTGAGTVAPEPGGQKAWSWMDLAAGLRLRLFLLMHVLR